MTSRLSTPAAMLLLVVFATLALSTSAEARPRRGAPPHRRAPHVVISASPWVFGYVPAPRAGWVWVDGHYTARRVWSPGYWRPVELRAGWVWTAGYWDGPAYVDGTWREEAREGWVWVDGTYDDGGHWVPGHWDAVSTAAPPPPAAPTLPDSAPLAIPADAAPPASPGDLHHEY